MFKNIFKPKLNLQAMSSLSPTSKFDLKLQCIAICRGKIEEAEKLYHFFATDLTLPDVLPPTPSVMEQIRSTAGGLFSFVRDNKDDIAQAYNYIQSIRQGNLIRLDPQKEEPQPSANPLPPLPPL
jgi:hypothetical protein